MKHRNLSRWVLAAASVSLAMAPVSALAADGLKTALLDDAVAYVEAGNAATDKNVDIVKTKFDAALTAAKATATTQDDVNAKWTELTKMIQYLDFLKADEAPLTSAIAAAEALDLTEYEEDEKMDAFRDALKAAQDKAAEVDGNTLAVDGDTDNDAAIKAVADDLTTAMANLTGVVVIEGQEFEPVYRLADKSSPDHLYTADENERSWALGEHKEMSATHTADAPMPNETDVHPDFTEAFWFQPKLDYSACKTEADKLAVAEDFVKENPDFYIIRRIYNPTTKEHLYTADANEVKWNTENAGWSLDDNFLIGYKGDGAQTLHRLNNEKARTHHYPFTENEFNWMMGLIDNTDKGWKQDSEDADMSVYSITKRLADEGKDPVSAEK